MKRVMFVILGVCMIAAGSLWLARNRQESDHAGAESVSVIPILRQELMETSVEEGPTVPQMFEMTEIEVNGRIYIGLLEIPKLELELPVLSVWNEENAKAAPCRFIGSIYQNNLIICAHNYKSHFGRLQELEVGDEVRFTDLDGNQIRFQTSGFEVLAGTAWMEMESGDWDLTLFTCIHQGKDRFVVRCESLG